MKLVVWTKAVKGKVTPKENQQPSRFWGLGSRLIRCSWEFFETKPPRYSEITMKKKKKNKTKLELGPNANRMMPLGESLKGSPVAHQVITNHPKQQRRLPVGMLEQWWQQVKQSKYGSSVHRTEKYNSTVTYMISMNYSAQGQAKHCYKFIILY